MVSVHRTMRQLGLIGLAVVFVCAGLVFSPSHASAVTVEEASAILAEAEQSMQSITQECDALSAEVSNLQKKIDHSAAQALDAQSKVLEGRDRLGEAASFEYRGDFNETLFSLILDSTSFEDFLRSVEYLNQIMRYQQMEIESQKQRQAEFNEITDTLNTQKNEQESKLAELKAKQDQARQVVEQASQQLADAQAAAEEAARLAALQAQAEALARQEAQASTTTNPDPIVDNATTVNRPDNVAATSTPVSPVPESTESPSSNTAPSGGAPSTGSSAPTVARKTDAVPSGDGWLIGVASAYGGSSDPSTPNPGVTATGAVCNDSSMGVALPISLPNYQAYMGRTIEIYYNGMTVYATVNDCGYMGNGSRALDLQPGVFKAFGFSSCKAWGLRGVVYRFL